MSALGGFSRIMQRGRVKPREVIALHKVRPRWHAALWGEPERTAGGKSWTALDAVAFVAVLVMLSQIAAEHVLGVLRCGVRSICSGIQGTGNMAVQALIPYS
jgi:hypothetical protein